MPARARSVTVVPVPSLVDVDLPYRWDLVSPDNFGTLLDGVSTPRLWFMPDLVECTAKVLARSGNGDLVFVGRSLDSMFDLLSGALSETDWRDRLHRLPLSFAGRSRITVPDLERARAFLASLGFSPHALARRHRPVTFVDIVFSGSTFTWLYRLLRPWIDRCHEPWPVIRSKLRFVGVTTRRKTSPNTFRWHQHAPWTRTLPASSVLNVSLDPWVWSYFGDSQTKLTRSFRPPYTLTDGPLRGERISSALAEALAMVEYGRSTDGRSALVRAMPPLREPWLRSLVVQLNPR
jgi:hypothetical protein